ncbi:MAG: hypothetical protein V1766_02185 [Pseudomonadota bacterium]
MLAEDWLHVFKMLLFKKKTTREMVAMLSTWRHSGVHVFYSNRIPPSDYTAMESLACCIIRGSFSQAKAQSLDQEGKVVYTSGVWYCSFRNTVKCCRSSGNPHYNSNLFDKPSEPVIEAGILLSGVTFPAGVKANRHLSRRIRP